MEEEEVTFECAKCPTTITDSPKVVIAMSIEHLSVRHEVHL